MFMVVLYYYIFVQCAHLYTYYMANYSYFDELYIEGIYDLQ